jgi:ribonuclease H2 subunit C
LKGAEFKVPANYTGIVCQEKKKPLSEDTDREFKAMHLFDSFTNWNYDRIPSKFDPLHKAMDWLDISNNLGEPIEFEEDEFKLWLENNKSKAE